MKLNEDVSATFFPEWPEMTKEGLVPLYCRITIGGDRKEMSLGYKILATEWDRENNCIHPSSKEWTAVDSLFTATKAKLQKHYLLLSAQFEIVTSLMLKKAYKGKKVIAVEEEDETKKREKKSVVEVFTIYVERFKKKVDAGNRSERTLKKWNTTKDKMVEFIQYQYKKSDLPIVSIDVTAPEDMYDYLTTMDGLSHNSAIKYISNTRSIFKYAVGRWININPYSNFRCSYLQPNRDILSLTEILELFKYPLNERLEKVRDCFVFSCFTGLAYQELALLGPQDIVIGDDGMKWLKIDRVKTGNPENVPLLPLPEALIKKYENDVECKLCEKLLPVISNQKYNEYLKELAEVCKINKHLTTHTGRHTFATTICLENGVPIETVSKMLGHKSIRVTQIYARITNYKVSQDMQLLSNKIFDKKGQLRPSKLSVAQQSAEAFKKIRILTINIAKMAA